MDIYRFFFSLSVLTDGPEFTERFISQGKRPYHDLKSFNWTLLGSNIRDILIKNHPEYCKRVSVKLFNDSLESATKPILSDNQQFLYMKELVSRAKDNNFKAHDLRNRQWMATHKQSAPPQDFNGIIQVQDDGTADVIEDVVNSIVANFYVGAPKGGLMMIPALLSGKLNTHCKLSKNMHSLFSKSFNHPFANDVSALFLGDAGQERFMSANSMLEVEEAS